MPAMTKQQVEDLETTDTGSGGSYAEIGGCSSASCSGSESEAAQRREPSELLREKSRLHRPSFAPTRSLRLPGARHFRGTPLPVIPSTPATKPGTWGCDDLSSDEEDERGFRHVVANKNAPPPPPLTPAPVAEDGETPPSPPAWDSSGFELPACPSDRLPAPPGLPAPSELRIPPGLPAPPGLAPPALPTVAMPAAPAWESFVRRLPAPPQLPPSITSTTPPNTRQSIPPSWDASSRDASSRPLSAPPGLSLASADRRRQQPKKLAAPMQDQQFCYSPMPGAVANMASKVPAR